MTDIRAILPTPTTGAPLNAAKGYFSVLVPIARTNEVTNPSFETGTTGWAAVGGTLARLFSAAPVGGACALILMSGATDGVRYSSLPMTAGELRACSCQFRGTAGRRYRFQIENGGGGTNARTVVTATGSWQEVVWYCQTLTTDTYYLLVGAMASGTDSFLLDGVQVEKINAGETYSSYIDGDQVGFVANPAAPEYGWNGAPHASTSYRSGQCRAGGMPMSFDLARFIITAIIGLGMAPAQHITSPYAQLDGARYERTRLTERTFNLVGRADGRDDAQRARQLALLESWLSRDATAVDQPLRLRFQRADGLTPIGAPAQIDAVYTGGLEGNLDTRSGAPVALQFTLYTPYITAVREEGAQLPVQQTVASANNIMQRTPAGQWQALPLTFAGGWPWLVRPMRDGRLALGGNFTSVNGNTSAVGIVIYDPTSGALTTLGTGANSGAQIQAIVEGADGKLYIGGSQSSINGNTSARGIAVYDPATATLSTIGTGTNSGGVVTALAFDRNGLLLIGGSFTGINGISLARIATYDPATATLAALGTGANNSVRAVAVGLDNTYYIGGDQTTLNGVSAAYVSAWRNGAAFAPGAAFNSWVQDLAVGPDGVIYAIGNFTAIGSTAFAHIAALRAGQWIPLSTGMSGIGNRVLVTPDNQVLITMGTAGGTPKTAGGVSLPDDMAAWRGGAWTPLDVDLPGTPSIYGWSRDRTGNLYITYTTTGSAVAAGVTDVTNHGERAAPVVSFSGPTSGTAQLYQIVNTTTKRAVYFNLTLSPGEIVTLTTDPERVSLISNFQGDVSGFILPGSQESDFFLQPGTNTISVFASQATVTATIHWHPTYQSLNGLLPR